MPVRILLIGAVVFLAAWFTVLRPKPESVDVPNIKSAATPQSHLGKAVDKAKAAIIAALAPHQGADGVALPGACWVVRAHKD